MQQVLMRISDSADAPRFELKDNPDNRAPLTFEDRDGGIRIPRLGTQDLLAIARFAVNNDYIIDEFIIEDRAFTRVSDADEEAISDELRTLLADKGVFEAALFVDRDWDAYVTGVKLTTPNHRTITLLRQGVTRAPEPFDVSGFLAGAWTAVHFS